MSNLTAVASSSSSNIYLVLDMNSGYPLTTREQVLLKYPVASLANLTYLSLKKGVTFDKLGRPSQAVLMKIITL